MIATESGEMVKKADVVVVGGGISGCATAYYLAKRGVKVALVEKGEIASEGSGTTFGILRDIGRDPLETPLANASLQIWENLSAELNCDIGYIQGGGIYVAETEEELERFEGYARTAHESGVGCRIINVDEVRKFVPPLEAPLAGGLYSEMSAHAEPVATVNCFANAARGLGAQIYTRTLCWGIQVKRGRVSGVATNRGEIKTNTVVNAAGVYANRVAKMVGFHIPLKVVALTVAETEPVPPQFRTWIRGSRCGATRQTIRGTIYFLRGLNIPIEYYIGFDAFQDLGIWLPRLRAFRELTNLRFDLSYLQREFRRLFSISRKARRTAAFPIFVPKPNAKFVETDTQNLYKTMPSLRGTKVARMWAGLVDFTPDMIPVMGELDNPKGFIIAAGFSGHGFTLGPITGIIISELVVDGKTSLSIEGFRPSRFAEGKFGMPADLI